MTNEFCLPPQFLTDDDTPFLRYRNANNLTPAFNRKNDEAVSRSMFSYLSDETESDEEEHINELTRRMAHSALNNNNHTFASEKNPKGIFVTGSPQSTLCALESSGKGASPNGGVLPHADSSKATWDLLRAAAGEVERMRVHEQEAYGVLRNTGKPSPVGVGFYSQQQQKQHLLSQQLQIAKFEMMRRQQLAMQQEFYGNWQRESINNQQMVPNRGRKENDVVMQGRNQSRVVLQRSYGLSASAWPPLQNAIQPRMGAVFPGNPSGNKGRKGTGVFLPSISTTAEARKKLACKTAMVPDRVAHAMNMNGKGVGGGYKQQKNRVHGISNMENSSTAYSRSDNGFSQQRRIARTQPQANHEIRLPQEWTY